MLSFIRVLGLAAVAGLCRFAEVSASEAATDGRRAESLPAYQTRSTLAFEVDTVAGTGLAAIAETDVGARRMLAGYKSTTHIAPHLEYYWASKKKCKAEKACSPYKHCRDTKKTKYYCEEYYDYDDCDHCGDPEKYEKKVYKKQVYKTTYEPPTHYAKKKVYYSAKMPSKKEVYYSAKMPTKMPSMPTPKHHLRRLLGDCDHDCDDDIEYYWHPKPSCKVEKKKVYYEPTCETKTKCSDSC